MKSLSETPPGFDPNSRVGICLETLASFDFAQELAYYLMHRVNTLAEGKDFEVIKVASNVSITQKLSFKGAFHCYKTLLVDRYELSVHIEGSDRIVDHAYLHKILAQANTLAVYQEEFAKTLGFIFRAIYDSRIVVDLKVFAGDSINTYRV